MEVFKEELTLLGVYDSAKKLQWQNDVLPQLITANTMGVQAFVDINDYETLLTLLSEHISDEQQTKFRVLYTGSNTERRNRLWRNIKFFLSVAKDIAAAEGPPQINDASST